MFDSIGIDWTAPDAEIVGRIRETLSVRRLRDEVQQREANAPESRYTVAMRRTLDALEGVQA